MIMNIQSDSNGAHDFDFIIGDWIVQHRRLNARLSHCSAWTEFEGQSSTRKILGGLGSLEDNTLHFPGESYHAAAMRSYCITTRTWSIWWLDGRYPTLLDKPVVGTFSNQTGLFFADDVLDGRPIKVRFSWLPGTGDVPRWEQAFSDDGGKHWETNWVMDFLRVPSQNRR